MKLATMKLVCLLVLLGSIFILGLMFENDYTTQARDYALQNWPLKTADGAPNLRLPGIIAVILLAWIGLYGFLPKLPSRKGKTITIKGANGEITLELKPIRKTLLKIMRRMPEVHAIELDVRPDRKRRRALIDAKVVLQNCAALGAQQCLKIVEETIYSTAQNLLGLEDCTVTMTQKGVYVNAAASGKQIREQLESRKREAQAITPATTTAEESKQAPEVKEETKTENQAVAADAAKQSEAPATPGTAVAEPEDEPEEETAAEEAEDQGAQDEAPVVKAEATVAVEAEEQTVEMPVVEKQYYEEPGPETSETLHGIDLPPLAEEDMDLPPGPKINQDGEITTDEAADADVAAANSGSDEKTPDAVEVDILSPVPWKKNEEMPEPVPDELSCDPEDVDVDTEEYHNT